VTARLLVGALLGLLASAVQAEQWLAAATAGSSGEYDSNPRLLSAGAEAAYGLVTTASADLSRRTEHSRLGLLPRIVVRRYTGDYALDSNDVYVNADYATRPDEHSEYSLTASYSRDGTLTSEYAATGFVPANIPRDAVGVQAAAGRSLSERTSAYGSVAYQDVSYEDGARYGLQDYRYWSGLGYLQRSVNERTEISFIARAALLEVPRTGGESQELTVGVGLDRDWNERWKSAFYLGPTFSEVNGTRGSVNASFRADVTGTWERSVLRLAAERLLSPDAGQGQLETHDQASVTLRHGLTEKLRAIATASVDYYSDPRDPRNEGGGYRSYSRVEIGLAWRASPHWSLSAGYEFAHRDDVTDASKHSLTASLTWSGLPRTVL
jgi:hypothetical protein